MQSLIIGQQFLYHIKCVGKPASSKTMQLHQTYELLDSMPMAAGTRLAAEVVGAAAPQIGEQSVGQGVELEAGDVRGAYI